VSHLRVIRDEPPKAKRRKGSRTRLFGVEETRALRAALRTLQGAYGSWPCLAEVMGVSKDTIVNAARGRNAVSAEVAIRAARAAGRPLESLLSPVPRGVR